MPDIAADLLLRLNIPFCAKKCSCCPLPVCGYDAGVIRAHGEAVLSEIEAASGDSAGYIVRAVSIEGGSPCLTEPDLLRDMLRAIRKIFACAEDVQIGIQTMPGDYSRALVQRMADEGVNFWTVGLQTASPEEHKLLGRPYLFDALTMVDTAVRTFPMRALNFELLYGIPGQTLHSWKRTLDAALAYEPEHLTLRPLLLLPGTPLYNRCREGQAIPCGDETRVELYSYAKERLEGLGYRGYAVDSFALPGYEDRFRLGLLGGTDCMGFGYLAESRMDGYRYRSGHSVKEYIEHSADPSVIADRVTRLEGAGELVQAMTVRLALSQGLDENALRAFGDCAGPVVERAIPRLVGDGLLERRADGRLYLTMKGIATGTLYRLGV